MVIMIHSMKEFKKHESSQVILFLIKVIGHYFIEPLNYILKRPRFVINTIVITYTNFANYTTTMPKHFIGIIIAKAFIITRS